MLVRPLILTASLGALAGCGSIASTLGLERHIPDETQVAVHPALTLPPDYGLMPPGTASAVSAEHEVGPDGTPATATASAEPEKQEEDRGFFGKLFHGDFFGNDVDQQAVKEHQAQAAASQAPDVNGTPQAPAPDAAAAQGKPASADVSATPQATSDAAQPPAPAPAQQDKPGFFGRLFDWF
jgi:hypothetical protein